MSSSRSGFRVAGLIVGGVGLVLGLAGFLVWRHVPGIVAAEHARLEALPTPDAISLTDVPPGREVIVEGRIAPDQPTRFRDFVAYVKEEERRDKRDDDGRGDWKVVETVTPPLHLIVGDDGSVRVLNANYAITFARTQWRDTARVIDTHYSGLVANEGVFVRGTSVAGGLEALTVGSGTRASYLAAVAGNADVGWWLGIGFMILAAVLVLVALVLFVLACAEGAAARVVAAGTGGGPMTLALRRARDAQHRLVLRLGEENGDAMRRQARRSAVAIACHSASSGPEAAGLPARRYQ